MICGKGIRRATDGKGIDVVLDPVGGMICGGRYLVVGFAAGDIPLLPLNLVLLKGCTICGVNMEGFVTQDPDAARDNLSQLHAWLDAGRLRPLVAKTYDLEHAADALNDMVERRVQGKAVLIADLP